MTGLEIKKKICNTTKKYLQMDNLERCFLEASKQRKKYVGIKVWMQGFQKAEIIINSKENFDKKLEYYQYSYNEDLTLKHAPDKIKIIGFTFGDTFEEIKRDLLGNEIKYRCNNCINKNIPPTSMPAPPAPPSQRTNNFTINIKVDTEELDVAIKKVEELQKELKKLSNVELKKKCNCNRSEDRDNKEAKAFFKNKEMR